MSNSSVMKKALDLLSNKRANNVKNWIFHHIEDVIYITTMMICKYSRFNLAHVITLQSTHGIDKSPI